MPELKVQEFSFERGLRAEEVVPTITPLSRYGERSAKGSGKFHGSGSAVGGGCDREREMVIQTL
ncbi:hypothetical protein NX869_28865, partial [Burkholderia thailandensis]|nr:hypothetical protein [Burkholderia thailandensis]